MIYSNFLVKREWQNIDILLESQSDKTVIIIENKVDSGESFQQTEKYRKKIETYYDCSYKKLFIYLTKIGEESSDTNSWNVADYGQIVESLKEVIEENPNTNSNVKLIIENYIEIIDRKVIMNNDELKEMCQKVYNKHKVALDLIYDHKPDSISNISDFIVEYLENNLSELGIVFNREYSSKSYVRYTTNFIDQILPVTQDKKYGWRNGYSLMYEIEILKNSKISLFATISKIDDELCSRIYEITQKDTAKFNITKKAKRPAGYARIYHSKELISVQEMENDFDNNKDILTKNLAKAIKDAKDVFEASVRKELV